MRRNKIGTLMSLIALSQELLPHWLPSAYMTLFIVLALAFFLPRVRPPLPGVGLMVLDILVAIPATIRDINRVVRAAGAPFLFVMLFGREAETVRKTNLASPS